MGDGFGLFRDWACAGRIEPYGSTESIVGDPLAGNMTVHDIPRTYILFAPPTHGDLRSPCAEDIQKMFLPA